MIENLDEGYIKIYPTVVKTSDSKDKKTGNIKEGVLRITIPKQQAIVHGIDKDDQVVAYIRLYKKNE